MRLGSRSDKKSSYVSSHWLTFKQALAYGGSVRKGEKSTAILGCEPRTKQETADDGTNPESRFWISKDYRVFNADQCDRLPESFRTAPVHSLDPAQRIEHADDFIRKSGATIRHDGGSAFIRPTEDFIRLPPFEAFTSPEGYDSTGIHELVNNAASRMMPTRLPRPRLARWRGLRQGLFTEGLWAIPSGREDRG